VQKIYLKDQKMQFGFTNVTVLYSDHRHVSTTYLAIFKVVRAEIRIYL